MRAETDCLELTWVISKQNCEKGVHPYLKGLGLKKNAGGQQLTIKMA